MRRILQLLLLSLLLSCGTKKEKFSVADVPDPKKQGGGYVSNPDHIISDSVVNLLNATFTSLDNAGSAQIAVVLLHTIGENESRDFAHQLFNHWKIGDRESNNGLLILLVEDAHKLVFETGKGLEATLPDVICFRIQQDYMIPHIKEGDFNTAFINGTRSVTSLLETGNYAFDAARDIEAPVADSSLINDSAAITATGNEAEIDVAPEAFTANGSSQQAFSDSYNRGPGDFSLFALFVALAASALMMRAFWGKKLKKPKPGFAELPAAVNTLPNEFLQPRWAGLFLIHMTALSVLGFIMFIKRRDTGFFLTLLVYYLVWTAYMHLFVAIMAVRAGMILRHKDRQEKWLRLEAVRVRLTPAGYIFPLPLLFIYLVLLKKQLNRLRNEPYDCPECLKPMQRLDETEDDHFLDKAQVIEEKLLSVDYDVWRCDPCDYELALDYTNMRTSLAECPSCAHKTFEFKKSKTQKRATTSAPGWGINTYICAACAFTHGLYF